MSTFLTTPDARRALALVRERHPNLIFHITLGCCDARSPLCLEAGDLRHGARDALIGVVDGVPVNEMAVSDDAPPPRHYILAAIPGVSVGFSLETGTGVRFTIRELSGDGFRRLSTPTEQTGVIE